MINWLKKSLILALHDQQLAEHGGSMGVRNDNLLESALARSQQVAAYSDATPEVCKLAASLAFGLARNHPFVDANKRAAIISCEVFLALNDTVLTATDLEIYPVILSLAEGHLSEEEFANWLSDYCKRTADNVQEKAAGYGKK